MTVLGILGMLVTVFGPVLAAGLLAWLENRKKENPHAAVDEADQHITDILKGNPIGRAELARQLERLSREAKRKLRHP